MTPSDASRPAGLPHPPARPSAGPKARPLHDLITFATAMLTITNPIGSLAIFAGLTAGATPAEKASTALRSALAVAVTLLVVAWAGGYLLDALGVTVAGLEMAGGVVIALMGLSMLRTQTSRVVHTPAENEEAKGKAAARESIAVVPMAIPIVAGPGAMTTVVVATHQHPAIGERLGISAICLGVAAVVWLALRFAGPVADRLGTSGLNVVTRVMGIVLTAIALEMLTTGLAEALPGLK